MSRYEVFKGANRQWYFRLKARNGRNVGPGEGYKTQAGALRGVDAHRRAAATLRVVVLTD